MDRLYARFDAIARGRAHRSVIARLESNQRRAADLGWTAFVLERAGSTGRLELLLRATGFALDRAPNMLPDLEAVTLPHGAVLFEARAAITHIYFPQRCVISLLTATGEGPGVEVGLIGNEGMAGLSVFLGGSSTAQAVPQVSDGAWRMEVGAFRRVVAQQPSLRDVLQRYTQSVISQVT